MNFSTSGSLASMTFRNFFASTPRSFAAASRSPSRQLSSSETPLSLFSPKRPVATSLPFA